MTRTIDFDEHHTEVFGRGRLRYMQDGHGFGADGEYLGVTNAQGELVKKADRPERARVGDGTFRADDPSTPNKNEAWEGGKAPEGTAVGTADGNRLDPEAYWQDKTVAVMKPLLEAKEVEIPSGAKKAQIVALAVEHLEVGDAEKTAE